jgi:nitrile hydratase
MPVLTKEMVPGLVKAGASARVAEAVPPKFAVGAKVRVKTINPPTHTRVPRYVRGKVGTVEFDHGVFALPETMAHGQGESPQHVYNVCFLATELWGAGVPVKDTLRIDLWDDHLEPVAE